MTGWVGGWGLGTGATGADELVGTSLEDETSAWLCMCGLVTISPAGLLQQGQAQTEGYLCWEEKRCFRGSATGN